MYLIIIELANACIYHPYWWNSQWFWVEKDENRFLSINLDTISSVPASMLMADLVMA